MEHLDKDGNVINVVMEFDLTYPCCRYKATGEIFEYFVYRNHMDENNYDMPWGDDDGGTMVYPEWYDGSLDLEDGDIVINHIGNGYVCGNKKNAAGLGTVGNDYQVVGSIERMFQYLDNI